MKEVNEQPHRQLFLAALALMVLNLMFPGEGNLLVAALTTVVITGLAVIHYTVFRGRVQGGKELIMPLLLLLALAVSQSASFFPHGSLRAGAYIILIFLFGWLVAEYRWSERQIRLFAWTVSVGAGLLSVYGFSQLFTFFADPPDSELVSAVLPVSNRYLSLVFEQKRIFATFLLPTSFSVFLSVSLPFTAGLLIAEKTWWKRVLFFLIGVVSLAALVQCKSHGGVAALFTGSGAVLLLYLKSRGWSWRTIALSVAGLFAAVCLLMLAIGAVRGNFLWDLGHFNSPITLRWNLWLAAFSVISTNGLMGVGAGGFPVALFPHVSELVRPTKYVHNTYLQFFLELGLLGLLFLLLLLLLLLRRGIALVLSDENKPGVLELSLVTAFFVFLAANAVEVVFYFQSLGLLGAMMAGLLLRRRKISGKADRRPLKLWKLAAVVTGVAFTLANLVWFTGDYIYQNVQNSIRQELLLNSAGTGTEQATGAIPNDTLQPAISQMEFAAALNAGDFRLQLMLADLYSHQARQEPERKSHWMMKEWRSLEAASEACPRQPNLRIRMANLLARLGQVLEAGVQAQIGAELYPYRTEYKQISDTINRSLERRLGSGMQAGGER